MAPDLNQEGRSFFYGLRPLAIGRLFGGRCFQLPDLRRVPASCGPFGGILQASATMVGLVAGLGEFIGQGFRPASALFTDRDAPSPGNSGRGGPTLAYFHGWPGVAYAGLVKSPWL
jgi:hypothetical protein